MNLFLNPRFGPSQLLVHSVGCVWFPPAGIAPRPAPTTGGAKWRGRRKENRPLSQRINFDSSGSAASSSGSPSLFPHSERGGCPPAPRGM